MNGLTRALLIAPWGSRAAMLILMLGACSRQPAAPEPTEMLVVTGLRGTTEPCGCTSHPMGGLDRLAGRVDALQPAVLAFVGETYFTPEAPQEQEAAKAELISNVFGHLKPAFVVTGNEDSAHQRIESSPSRTLKIGEANVAVITQTKLDCNLVPAPADVRVLLLGEESHDCEPDVDFVIVAGGENPRGPRQLGKAIWLDAGDKGRYIGHLAFKNAAVGGAWTVDDGGRAALSARDAMVSRLKKEIDALDDGPAKEARQTKLAALEAKPLDTNAATGRIATWSLDIIDSNTAKAEWAAPMIRQFNESLCDITKAATAKRVCEKASQADTYVGNAQCRACHAEAFAVYNQTKHARAWPTLKQAAKACDLSCIGCHSVGYAKPGGYCRLDDVEPFENVGCENCHGPGGGHIAHPDDREQWSSQFRRGRTADNCMQCHTHEHSDQFNFDTYLPQILGPGHAGAMQR